jgi:hypothetical protein
LGALLARPVQGEVGSGVSGLFTVDTRYGFSLGSGVSSFFTVDTSRSAWAVGALSSLFTVDTRGATIGVGYGISRFFTVDTRYGFSSGAEVSDLFTVDTRHSGWSGEGFSPLFTVDTRSYQIDPPILTAEGPGTGLILSWYSTTIGYQLEVSSSLSSPSWSVVTNVPTLSGMRRSVAPSFTSQSQFYRLKRD